VFVATLAARRGEANREYQLDEHVFFLFITNLTASLEKRIIGL
jgi:hypothetical protein